VNARISKAKSGRSFFVSSHLGEIRGEITAPGLLRVVDDAGNDVGHVRVTFKDEPAPKRSEAEPMPASREPLAPQMQRLVEARVAVCNQCDKNKGIRGTVRGYEVWRVKCSSCGCAGLSMRDGECPEEKWPTEVQSSE